MSHPLYRSGVQGEIRAENADDSNCPLDWTRLAEERMEVEKTKHPAVGSQHGGRGRGREKKMR
jgi:hypothetical protein